MSGARQARNRGDPWQRPPSSWKRSHVHGEESGDPGRGLTMRTASMKKVAVAKDRLYYEPAGFRT